MPKKYIKAGVPVGDLYDVVNALTGAQEDGSQGDATLGPGGEIVVDKDGNITMNPPDGSVHTTVDNAIKLNNQPASYYAKTTDAFATYTHSFSGGVHNLTGTGDNIKFISVADYNGEPIKVNGTTCTARTIGGDNIWAGFFKRDNMVTCFKKGTILNFNGGGLASSEIAKLTPQNIKTGVSITANGKTVTGNFTADGNVAANQMLNGRVAYSKGQRFVGTIPSKGSQSYRPTTYDQTISAGQYLSGNQTIQGDGNLRSDNIRDGVTIFGVRGNVRLDTLMPSGTHVLLGYDISTWPEMNPGVIRNYTVPETGNYVVALSFKGHDRDNAGQYQAKISKNGVTIKNSQSNKDLDINWTETIYCNKGDTIQVLYKGYFPSRYGHLVYKA